MKYFLPLLLLLFFLLPAGASSKFDIHPVKRIEANPINVAVMLTEQPDTAAIATTCEYYGYIRQIPQDDYTVFTHPNGSIIRYIVSDSDTTHPTIEVTGKATASQKDQILKELNFKKSTNGYERRSIGYVTRCTDGTHGSLRLTSHPKSKK